MKNKTPAFARKLLSLLPDGIGTVAGAIFDAVDDDIEETNLKKALVLEPDGVHLNAANLIIPWDMVRLVIDANEYHVGPRLPSLLVVFVGGFNAGADAYSNYCADGWEEAYANASSKVDDLDEKVLREAAKEADIDTLKVEWARRKVSFNIALGVCKNAADGNAVSDEITYGFAKPVATAIAFGNVYAGLAKRTRRQIVAPEEVKAVLSFWLDACKIACSGDEEDHYIVTLKKLIHKLER